MSHPSQKKQKSPEKSLIHFNLSLVVQIKKYFEALKIHLENISEDLEEKIRETKLIEDIWRLKW